MRGDDELGELPRQIMQPDEHRQLALGRKRGLRFVEKVDAVPAQPLSEQIEAEPRGPGRLLLGEVFSPVTFAGSGKRRPSLGIA